MKRNFQFDGISVVRWGDRLIDLHNAYDLERFGTDLKGGEATLSFIRNGHAIDPEKLPARVTICCAGSVTVAFNDLGKIAAPLSDRGLEIAYFNDDCDWFSFLDELIAERREPLGLHVSFSDVLAVRIFCDEATLSTE